MADYTLEEIEQARQQGYFIDPSEIQRFREQAANLGGRRVSEEGKSLRDPNAYEAYMQAIKGGLQEAGKTKKDFFRRPMSAIQSALQESLGVNEYGDGMPVEYAPTPPGAERYRMWEPGKKPNQKAIDAWERYNWAVENNNNAVKNEASRELRLYGHTPRSMDKLRTSVPAEEPKHLLDLNYQRALWESHKKNIGVKRWPKWASIRDKMQYQAMKNPVLHQAPPQEITGEWNGYYNSLNPRETFIP